MAHAGSDSEMDSYDRLMDDAMGVWHECFEENYGKEDFDEVVDEDEEYAESIVVDSEMDEGSRNNSGDEDLFDVPIEGGGGSVLVEAGEKGEPKFFEVPVEEINGINGAITLVPLLIHEEKPSFNDADDENDVPEDAPNPDSESEGDDNNVETLVGGFDSDGEDPVERNEYEIALLASEFEEEPEIRHDVYYDSACESNEEGGNRRSERSFNPRYDGILYKW